MKYGQIAGITKPVSRLVMGTMIYSTRDMSFCCEMLDYFVSLGGNCIDTALVYGGSGEAERAIGQWLTLKNNREEMVLVAKGAHHGPEGPRVNPRCIAADLESSLGRLQTDYVDLYLLHRDDPNYPVGEIVECLNEHQKAGRIRAFGGSNWTVNRLQAANDYARDHGLIPFAASSPNFSLAAPNVPRWAGCTSTTASDREWYLQRQFPLLAWSSQAGGFFTGRFRKEDPSDPEMVRVWYSEENFERLSRVNELARQKKVLPLQIAFAYVICQPFPTFALIGPRTTEETRTSAGGLDVTLTAEELAWLNLED